MISPGTYSNQAHGLRGLCPHSHHIPTILPGGEKQDLDKPEALTMDGAFGFTTLFSEYEIKRRNPIAVELSTHSVLTIHIY